MLRPHNDTTSAANRLPFIPLLNPPQHDPHPILNPLAIPDKIPATADITFHTGVAARCGLDTPGAGTAAAGN